MTIKRIINGEEMEFELTAVERNILYNEEYARNTVESMIAHLESYIDDDGEELTPSLEFHYQHMQDALDNNDMDEIKRYSDEFNAYLNDDYSYGEAWTNNICDYFNDIS